MMNECKCIQPCDCLHTKIEDFVKNKKTTLEKIQELTKALEAGGFNAKPFVPVQGLRIENTREDLEAAAQRIPPEELAACGAPVTITKPWVAPPITLKVEDVSEKFKDAFTNHAWKMMQNKIPELEVWNTPLKGDPASLSITSVGQPKCISSTVMLNAAVREGEPKSEAISRVIEMVNEFATRRWMVGVLAPLSKIDLIEGGEAYFCFVHIKYEFYNNARKLARSEGFVIGEGQPSQQLESRELTDHVRFQGERNSALCPICGVKLTSENSHKEDRDLCARCSDNKFAKHLFPPHDYGMI